MEEDAADYAAAMTKPIAAFIAGRAAPPGKRMGHAGAIVTGSRGSHEAKRQALEAAGVEVLATPTAIGQCCCGSTVCCSGRRLTMQLDDLLRMPVEPTTKGWPARAGALPLREVGRQGWNLLRQDLPLPVAVLKAAALANNSRWMRGFLEHFDVRLCPHGKTTMAPQLFARQLADGAWGITVATVQQLMVCRRFGVPRVLLANQLIGREAIRTVIAELEADPGFEFLCVVDSLAGVGRCAPSSPPIRSAGRSRCCSKAVRWAAAPAAAASRTRSRWRARSPRRRSSRWSGSRASRT